MNHEGEHGAYYHQDESYRDADRRCEPAEPKPRTLADRVADLEERLARITEHGVTVEDAQEGHRTRINRLEAEVGLLPDNSAR